MEYFSVIKKTKIVKFAGKREELKPIILNEVTQKQTKKMACFLSHEDSVFMLLLCISIRKATGVRGLVMTVIS